MRNRYIITLCLLAPLAFPTFANAQDNGPVTRAQVRAELVQLEQAGYRPGSEHTTYPQKLQAAQKRVNAQNASSFGGSAEGSSASGSVSSLPALGVSAVDFRRS